MRGNSRVAPFFKKSKPNTSIQTISFRQFGTQPIRSSFQIPQTQKNFHSFGNSLTKTWFKQVNNTWKFQSRNYPGRATTQDIETVQQTLSRPKFTNLRKQLESDARFRITEEEYYSIAAKNNVSMEEAQKFIDVLHEATVITKLKQAPKFIFLKPDLLSKHMLDIFDPEISENQREINKCQAELTQLLGEKEELDKAKVLLDKKAERASTRFMWYLFGGMLGQAALIARLTWWELSWDVMEPITYILTYSTGIFFLAYFTIWRREYTYEGIWDRLARKKKDSLYVKHNFNIERYNSILSQVSSIEDRLIALGASFNLPHKHEAITDGSNLVV